MAGGVHSQALMAARAWLPLVGGWQAGIEASLES